MPTPPITLVLVHGGTFTSTMWDEVVPRLTTPALAVDLPGRRYRPADLPRVNRHTWVQSVCDDLRLAGLTDVVLVGHSSGGYVIPGVAAVMPEAVRGMVFVAATVPAEGRAPIDYLRPDLRSLALETRDATTRSAAARRSGACGRARGRSRPTSRSSRTDRAWGSRRPDRSTRRFPGRVFPRWSPGPTSGVYVTGSSRPTWPTS